MATAKKRAKKTTSRKDGARIPERARDMPGGPGGGAPITPPKKKRKAARSSSTRRRSA